MENPSKNQYLTYELFVNLMDSKKRKLFVNGGIFICKLILLIGNGFNYGLGISTGYKEIFQKMLENSNGIYKYANPMVKECWYDLEKFIGQLESDIDSQNIFLKKYINNKIKFDFMQATHEIVKSEIKNIYAEKNEGIFLLLKNFTNYYSLNYDSFLYTFLLKYKQVDNDENNAIALTSSIKFIEEDLNVRQTNIYSEIKEARKNGKLEISFGKEIISIERQFDKLTKSHFTTEVKEYSKTNKKEWKAKEIERVVNSIFEEEQRNKILNKVDDGSQLNLFDGKQEFVFNTKSKTQNLFFLHGAFHIYKDGQSIKKITQESEKALYNKLEEVLNNEDQDVVCVFQQENKIDAINENKYLKNCLEKLKEISGNLVIIGSSLADNDDHIFKQINDSKVENIYISSRLKSKDKNLELAKKKFPSKKFYLFDADTISYELPEESKK
jgi:Domain of unknown function (DUF4917)